LNKLPTLSILLNTAREDFSLVGLPETFLFSPTILSLNKQELQNFELVIVDACYSIEREHWLREHAVFPFKYLPALPNRFLEKGMCAIASMKNLGLKFAEGELVVFIDDCCHFPAWWTQRISDWFQRGYWPMSLTYYYESGQPKLLGKSTKYVENFYGKDYDKEANLHVYIKKGEVVRDSRADFVNAHGIVNAPGRWGYGGSSASLESLLRINGTDERFDSVKGLEDVDTFLRLEQAGYKGLFLLDPNLWHVENWHKSLSSKVLFYSGSTNHCNYGLLQYNQLKAEFRANTKILTRQDCEFIRNHVCPNCDNLQRCKNEEFKGKFFIECEGFEYWLTHQRTFDLREDRLNI